MQPPASPHQLQRLSSPVPLAATSRGLAVQDDQDDTARRRGGSYSVRNLVSDGFVPADHTDPQLVNAWGIGFAPNAPVWVNDNRTGLSTLYDGLGAKQALVVTIPPPTDGVATVGHQRRRFGRSMMWIPAPFKASTGPGRLHWSSRSRSRDRSGSLALAA